jgi:hypothetical protein
MNYAYGVSGNDVVGYYNNESGLFGFLYDTTTGTYTTFSVPGEQSTIAKGIDGNDIVGLYSPGNDIEYAFLATPAPEPSTLTLAGLSALALWLRSRAARAKGTTGK